MNAPCLFLVRAPVARAILKALRPGERWITVTPPGHEKGQPVLVRDNPDGSATVIGGAGGKLNYLRLRQTRSKAEYAEEARKRAAGAREAKKQQRQRDKELGIDKAKQEAGKKIDEQRGEKRQQFIRTVAEKLGWKPETLQPDEAKLQGASPEAAQKAKVEHEKELFRKAKEAVDQARRKLTVDAEARKNAGLDEIPFDADPDTVTLDDFDPDPGAGKSLGYSPDYGKRAEAAGADQEAIRKEAEELKTPDAGERAEKEAKRAERKDKADQLKQEAETLRGPVEVDPKAKIDDKAALELLKADKEYRHFEQAARKTKQKLAGAEVVEPDAFVVEAGPVRDLDKAVREGIENDLRTLSTRGFLEEAVQLGGEREALGRHIGVGAYNGINAVALTAGGHALVDRSVVDVLGTGGAAELLARRLRADLGDKEYGELAEAMGRYHVEHYLQAADEALNEARDWHEMAKEIELGEAANGGDLAELKALNAKRRGYLDNAKRVLGTTLGELEANAALVKALGAPAVDQVQVSLGKLSVEAAITRARALGLERGDYAIEQAGKSTLLTVKASGLDRLAQPVDRADLEHTRKALDIIEGKADEPDWLPEGIARRPDLAMDVQPGVAPKLSEPFTPGTDLARSIEDYIGGRTADGDAPADILADLLSQDLVEKVGDGRRDDYFKALDTIAPLHDKKGKPQRAETHQDRFNALADRFVKDRYGVERSPLHRQTFTVDETATEALHRALAEEPAGVAAFKPIGELTRQDRRALRGVFQDRFAVAGEEAAALKEDLDKLDSREPEKNVEDMFGETGTNPAWLDWKAKRDELAEQHNAASLSWDKYVRVMGGREPAYAALQDVVRSTVTEKFAEAHNRLKPDAPLKLGRTVIRNNLDHLDAVDRDAREARLEQQRSLIDRLRNRVAGQYASGSVADKLSRAREAMEAAKQSQMSFFGTEDLPDANKEQPLAADQRHTLGQAAEKQIAGMVGMVGKNFKPGEKTPLWSASMNGKYIGQQRAVKAILHNKRAMLALSAGSGKTLVSLGAFTHLHSQGKAKKALYIVPSVVQGQFHGEAIRYLEPGRFNWHIAPGASHEERVSHYKNPDTHFSVVTHQAFRDDMLRLAAKQNNSAVEAEAVKLEKMTPHERRDYLKGVMQTEGISPDYLAVDEGHNLLNRAGKENSRMANVIDAVSANSPFYVNMTADPIKNDPSEAFDLMAKLDPERYRDRDAFMRRYGVDTAASQENLRREMARYFMTGKVESGQQVQRREESVKINDVQQQRLKAIDQAAADVRIARLSGTVNIDAAKRLSPESFRDVPDDQHEAIAAKLHEAAGVVRNAKVQAIIDDGDKAERLAQLATERKGKPGVVFAHRLDTVQQVSERLQKDGHKVVTLTGADSSADKARKREAFQNGEADIIICSDAGATGANLQRGQWLVQYDTPPTAMVHSQRSARVNRLGQKNPVELVDLVADHPAERKARERLKTKYELRDIMTSPLAGLDDTGLAGMLARIKAEKSGADNEVSRGQQQEKAAA